MVIRMIFCLLLILLSALLILPSARELLTKRNLLFFLCAMFVASRLAGWLVSYVLFDGLVQHSDLILYYQAEAAHIMSGDVPYRDFPSSYGLLFPYFVAALLPFWSHPAAVALPLILAEITTVLLFVKLLLSTSDPDLLPINLSVFVYLLHPSALYWSGMTAYNSSMVQLFWVILFGLLLMSRYAAVLVVMFLSPLVTKVLSVLVVPIVLVHPSRRASFLVVALALSAVAWLIAMTHGIDLLSPLIREGNRSTSGNIWFVIGGLFPNFEHTMAWRLVPPMVMACSILGFSYACFLAWRSNPSVLQLSAAFATVGLLFMVLSKKSYPHYLPMFLLFLTYAICAAHRPWRWLPALMLLGAVGVIEPGLWNAVGQPTFLPIFSLSELTPTVLALTVADVILIVCSVALLAQTVRVAVSRDRI